MKTNLSYEMKNILESYSDEVMNAVIDVLAEVAEESAEELKTEGTFENRTGKYRRGWKSKVENRRTYATAQAFNKTRYQLTHLLEFGHAIRGGGRKKEKTDAFPHISVVNERAQERAYQRILEAIGKIK